MTPGLFHDLQNFFQIHQVMVKSIGVHRDVIHKRGRDISYGMQNLLDSSNEGIATAFLTIGGPCVLIESSVPDKRC